VNLWKGALYTRKSDKVAKISRPLRKGLHLCDVMVYVRGILRGKHLRRNTLVAATGKGRFTTDIPQDGDGYLKKMIDDPNVT
jgi:hypothetical protein